MKMVIIKNLKEIPMEAKQVGVARGLCNSCGNKVAHDLFELRDNSFISCPVCKIRWEVIFIDAKGTA